MNVITISGQQGSGKTTTLQTLVPTQEHHLVGGPETSANLIRREVERMASKGITAIAIDEATPDLVRKLKRIDQDVFPALRVYVTVDDRWQL